MYTILSYTNLCIYYTVYVFIDLPENSTDKPPSEPVPSHSSTSTTIRTNLTRDRVESEYPPNTWQGVIKEIDMYTYTCLVSYIGWPVSYDTWCDMAVVYVTPSEDDADEEDGKSISYICYAI